VQRMLIWRSYVP